MVSIMDTPHLECGVVHCAILRMVIAIPHIGNSIPGQENPLHDSQKLICSLRRGTALLCPFLDSAARGTRAARGLFSSVLAFVPYYYKLTFCQ